MVVRSRALPAVAVAVIPVGPRLETRARLREQGGGHPRRVVEKVVDDRRVHAERTDRIAAVVASGVVAALAVADGLPVVEERGEEVERGRSMRGFSGGLIGNRTVRGVRGPVEAHVEIPRLLLEDAADPRALGNRARDPVARSLRERLHRRPRRRIEPEARVRARRLRRSGVRRTGDLDGPRDDQRGEGARAERSHRRQRTMQRRREPLQVRPGGLRRAPCSDRPRRRRRSGAPARGRAGRGPRCRSGSP